MSTPQESFINTLTSSWLNTRPLSLYSILIGITIFLLIWLDGLLNIDLGVFTFRSMTFRTIAFIVSSAFILIPLAIMLISGFLLYVKIAYLRIKYPQNKLDGKFVLIHFNGRVFLVDTEAKVLKWIQTWQTALDLKFIDRWTDSKITLREPDIFNSSEIVTTKDGLKLTLKEYCLGNPIYTRDTPIFRI